MRGLVVVCLLSSFSATASPPRRCTTADFTEDPRVQGTLVQLTPEEVKSCSELQAREAHARVMRDRFEANLRSCGVEHKYVVRDSFSETLEWVTAWAGQSASYYSERLQACRKSVAERLEPEKRDRDSEEKLAAGMAGAAEEMRKRWATEAQKNTYLRRNRVRLLSALRCVWTEWREREHAAYKRAVLAKRRLGGAMNDAEVGNHLAIQNACDERLKHFQGLLREARSAPLSCDEHAVRRIASCTPVTVELGSVPSGPDHTYYVAEANYGGKGPGCDSAAVAQALEALEHLED